MSSIKVLTRWMRGSHGARRAMTGPPSGVSAAQVLLELLEPRTLFSGEPWGLERELVGQDVAAEFHPDLDGSGQTIAVIDTGIDYTHPALGGSFGPGFKVVGGWDFVDNDADPRDTYGHGTAVAGVLAASGFVVNGRQYRGVAPEAQLVALRIDESNEPVPDERIERALRWVLENRRTFGITVVNISFGYGSFHDDQVNSVFGDELRQLNQEGIIVVASSGNAGVSDPPGIEYPGADPTVLSVGAVDSFGTIAEFSQRNELLDLLAPGDDVMTTDLVTGGTAVDDFKVASGTSFAAPFVAGTVALMRQASPGLMPADIHSILLASSSDNFDGDDEFGVTTLRTYPMLDINDALELTLSRRPGLLGSNDGVAPFANGNSIDYDADGVVHFAYYDSVDRTLKYATRSRSGQWSTASVIDTSDADLGQYVSLAHDRFGRPAVAYFDGSDGDLKFARLQGSQWQVEKLEWKGSVGLYPTLLFDREDRPAISYYYKHEGDLKLARQRSDGTWQFSTIDAGEDVGRSTSMAMDENGLLAIAYEDTRSGHLKFAREQANGSYTLSEIDGSTLGVAWISLAFDASHRASVSYYDAYPANLKFAVLDGGWKSETLAARGAVGPYDNLAFDNQGRANILFHNRRMNETVLARGSFGSWTFTTLETGGGKFIALDTDGEHLTYSWSQTDNKLVHVETV